MQNNFYYLRQLTQLLRSQLVGFTLVSCFSQNKEELVIEFNNAKESLFLRGDFSPAFCCLSFPASFARARKNSVDLFPELIMKKVTGLRQFENERSFMILLEGKTSLLLKMHGSRANAILMEDQQVKSVFRNHLKEDFSIDPDGLDRKIDWSHSFFLEHTGTLRQDYFTLGKPVWRHLVAKGFDEADTQQKWILMCEMIKQLEHPVYYICRSGEKSELLLFTENEVVAQFGDPVSAINEFYSYHVSTGAFFQEKTAAVNQLQREITSGNSYIQKAEEKLSVILTDDHWQAWADLIMANMHNIPKGAEKISVDDFYNNNTPVEISLKKTLSPQKNAEVYYRKSKNKQIEIKKIKEIIAAKSRDVTALQTRFSLISATTDLKDLRKKTEAAGVKGRDAEKQPVPLPYREFEFKGYHILVGRNAGSNDQLTLKHSYKEDLWLHAKDVAGSHVLLKYQAGKNFPKDVIEHAAGLAAFYSKRKNEQLCPVAYTAKKYVRKRKGDPAGEVVVEREEVILVEPHSG